MLFVFFLQRDHEHHERESHFLSKPNISGFHFFAHNYLLTACQKCHITKAGLASGSVWMCSFPDRDLLRCSKATEHQGDAGEEGGLNLKAAQSSAARQGAVLPSEMEFDYEI